MVKVSVIVPVYNVEQYIEKCIVSLVNQTLKEIEIIFVNDGSPDNSQKIIDKYKKKDKRIVSIIKENGGQGSARNMGIKAATGEYIAFVDSDDWIEKNMLEIMYKKAKEDNSDIVFANAYKVQNNQKRKYNIVITQCESDIDQYILNGTGPLSKLIKKKIIVDNDLYFPEGIIYEDYACIPLYGLYAKKISFIDDYLYNYLIRENSTMTQKYNNKFNNILVASNILLKKSSEISKEKVEEFEYLIVENLLRDTYFRLRNEKAAKKLLKEATEFVKEKLPNFMNNKYVKEKGNKYRIITYLIYKRQYWLLNIINKL